MNRFFQVFAYWLVFSVLASSAFSFPPATISLQSDRFVYVEGEKLMLSGKQFVVKGYNYFPRDYGWTSMADWDWGQVDKELALAKEYGANTIRTGFAFQYATGNLACENVLATNQISQEYLTAIDKFLDIAEKHNLKVIFWLGDFCWQFWNPAYYDGVQKYLVSLIPSYANDARIIAWDLYTDVDGGMLQGPPKGGFGEVPYSTKEGMVTLLRGMASTIRELDQNHLITVGVCWPSSSLLLQDFTDFLMPQFLGGDAPNILSSDDAAVVEEYGKWGSDRETVVAGLEDKVRFMQSRLTHPMPIVLAEYGAPSAGEGMSPSFQQDVYDTTLEIAFLRMKLAGALNWALTDFTWPPKAETYVPTDESQVNAYEQSFGILDLNYDPKPSAEVARKYYADHPQIGFQTTPIELTFVFNKSFFPNQLNPSSDDDRELCAAFDNIIYQDANGKALLELDIGAPQARPYLAQGFFTDEGAWGAEAESFAWAGGPAKTARVVVPFPEGTQDISFRASNDLNAMQVDIFVDGTKVTTLPMQNGWRSYSFHVPETEPVAIENKLVVRGAFDLPISDGAVGVQTSYDQITWQDAASATPVNGRFSAPIQIKHGGTLWLRAVWEGAGSYQSATSEILRFEIPRMSSKLDVTSAVTPTQTGNDILISGRLESAVNDATVTIELTKPDGSRMSKTVTTTSGGVFNYQFAPDQAGAWSATIDWPGNSDYEAAESSVSLAVTEAMLPKPKPQYGLYGAVGLAVILCAGIGLFWFLRRSRRAQ